MLGSNFKLVELIVFQKLASVHVNKSLNVIKDTVTHWK